MSIILEKKLFLDSEGGGISGSGDGGDGRRFPTGKLNPYPSDPGPPRCI